MTHITTTHIPLARTSHMDPPGHHVLVTTPHSGWETQDLGEQLAVSTTIMFYNFYTTDLEDSFPNTVSSFTFLTQILLGFGV